MIVVPVKEGENIEKALKKFKRKNTRARISQQDVPEKSSNAERICLDGHWKI